jgi:hypothetical protein
MSFISDLLNIGGAVVKSTKKYNKSNKTNKKNKKKTSKKKTNKEHKLLQGGTKRKNTIKSIVKKRNQLRKSRKSCK